MKTSSCLPESLQQNKRQTLYLDSCKTVSNLSSFPQQMNQRDSAVELKIFDKISIREDALVIRRHDDPEFELTIVPNTGVKHIIRYYHEGPGGAHQAPKATSERIIGCFLCPNHKQDVQLYVACCQPARSLSDSIGLR